MSDVAGLVLVSTADIEEAYHKGGRELGAPFWHELPDIERERIIRTCALAIQAAVDARRSPDTPISVGEEAVEAGVLAMIAALDEPLPDGVKHYQEHVVRSVLNATHSRTGGREAGLEAALQDIVDDWKEATNGHPHKHVPEYVHENYGATYAEHARRALLPQHQKAGK